MTQRMVDKASGVLEKRTSRRGFLIRLTIAGSAITVGPLRYLLRPGTAYASVTCHCPNFSWASSQVTCTCTGGSSCTYSACEGNGGECCDGYTTFCCSINNGSNSCPSGSFVGGWWQCDQSPYCLDPHGFETVRYYIDCNALCNSNCGSCTEEPPGPPYNGYTSYCGAGYDDSTKAYGCIDSQFKCKCANGACDSRATSCNWFRYGQCNTGHDCAGPVVCRVASCTPPWDTYTSCSSSGVQDANTCNHTASCL